MTKDTVRSKGASEKESVVAFLIMWKSIVTTATQGGRGFFQFIILKSNSITKGSLGRSQEAGTCREELRQTLWKNTAYWLAPHDTCSSCFLLHPRITSAKAAPLTVSWGLTLAGLFQETWVVCHSPLLGVRVGHFYKWKVMSQVLQ